MAEESDETLEYGILVSMANNLAQKIQHPEIVVVPLDLPHSYLEVVEQRHDQ